MPSLLVLLVVLFPSSSQNWHTVDTHQSDSTLIINKLFVEDCRDAWVAHDKFLHCATSTAFSGFTYYCMVTHGAESACKARTYSLSLTACVGIAKEIYDGKKKGCFSWKDLLWNGVGLTVSFFAFMR